MENNAFQTFALGNPSEAKTTAAESAPDKLTEFRFPALNLHPALALDSPKTEFSELILPLWKTSATAEPAATRLPDLLPTLSRPGGANLPGLLIDGSFNPAPRTAEYVPGFKIPEWPKFPNQPVENGKLEHPSRSVDRGENSRASTFQTGFDLGLSIRRDANNRVEEITYPGGKRNRTFQRDESGAVIGITTRDEKGERQYFKEGNKWFLSVDGLQLALPGNIHVSAKGDVSIEVKSGVWQTESPNGDMVTEQSNDNGSRVARNKSGKLAKIVRKDGSSIEASYGNDGEMTQVAEFGADGGTRAVWLHRGDRWESQDGKELFKHIELLPNGIAIRQNVDGNKVITLGDGKQLTELAGAARFGFDRNGRFDSIAYANGDELQFQYDANGKICVVTKFTNGKIVKTSTRDGNADRWQSKDGNGRELAGWVGEIEVTDAAHVRTRDHQSGDAPGYWTVMRPDGSTCQEKRNDDGSRTIINSDKSIVEINKDESVRRVATAQDTYTKFDYDDRGQLEKVTSFWKGQESSSWQRKSEPRLDMKVSINGDLTYRTLDGGTAIQRANQTKMDFDAQGLLIKVTQPGGASREFGYTVQGGERELSTITDRRKSGAKELVEIWSRKAPADGSHSNTFVCDGNGGKTRIRADVTLGKDGDYEYKTSDGKLHIAKAGRDRSGENEFSDSAEEARDRLVEKMEAHLDEPRRRRFQAILSRFEQRAHDRVEAQAAGGMEPDKAQDEWDQKVARTYDHLAHMVTSNEQGATYDLNTRAKLVENAVFAMAWPAKANDQGDWGCCWQIAGVYLGVNQHPDKMARMLDELSTTGKFTDTNGKSWTPPSHLLQFSDQGGSWTIANCGDTRRSPVSEIWTSVAAYLSENGRRMDRGSRGGSNDACMHAMKLITGDTWPETSRAQMTSARNRQVLLLKGGLILHAPGHNYLGLLEKNRGQWQAVSSSQHGDGGRLVNGVISDLKSWMVQRSTSHYTPDIPKFEGCNDQPIGRQGPRQRYRSNRRDY